MARLLTDLSANGTFVNGELLGPNNVCQLYEGDVVSFLLLSPDGTESALGYVVLFNRVGEDPHMSSVAATQVLFLREQQKKHLLTDEARDIISFQSSESKVRSYAQPRRERVSAARTNPSNQRSQETDKPQTPVERPIVADSPFGWLWEQQQNALEHFGFLPFYSPPFHTEGMSSNSYPSLYAGTLLCLCIYVSF